MLHLGFKDKKLAEMLLALLSFLGEKKTTIQSQARGKNTGHRERLITDL